MISKESSSVHWILVAAIAAAWGMSLSIQQNMNHLIIAIAGMLSLLLLLFSVRRIDKTPNLLWDGNRGVLGIIRGWNVEVCSLRLIRSVPLGIDLSHSAKKVFSAMATRYDNEPGGRLEFVLCRPLGNSVTRVGFIVSRRSLRLPNGIHRVEDLADKVLEDAFVLESAMRAAYPHTPISTADVPDIQLIRRGGIEVDAKA
ncbi:MAG: hypothetical protein ACFFD3_04565 [Candidatus Thorarchaeota archaeon]